MIKFCIRMASLLLLASSMATPFFAVGQTTDSGKDWATLQGLLGGIHGISTTPPGEVGHP